jgi:hypothetical protein
MILGTLQKLLIFYGAKLGVFFEKSKYVFGYWLLVTGY